MSHHVVTRAEARERASRPRRYPVHIGICYRPLGEKRWRRGKTDNFCRTGMMFWTNETIKLDTHVEMSFQLPAYIEGKSGASVICEGNVKRVVGSSGHLSYAVAITKYKIVRGPKVRKALRAAPGKNRRR